MSHLADTFLSSASEDQRQRDLLRQQTEHDLTAVATHARAAQAAMQVGGIQLCRRHLLLVVAHAEKALAVLPKED